MIKEQLGQVAISSPFFKSANVTVNLSPLQEKEQKVRKIRANLQKMDNKN
jgi:hypothetical protein